MTLYLIIRQNHQQKARSSGSGSSSNLIIINLCLATFLLCGTSSFFDAYTLIIGTSPDGVNGDGGVVCIIFAFLHNVLFGVSAHSSCAIALHRLFAVLNIEHNHNHNSNNKYIRARAQHGTCQHNCISSNKLTAIILISYTW